MCEYLIIIKSVLIITHNIKNTRIGEIMKTFEIEISLPAQGHFPKTESFETSDITQIQEKFYSIQWRRIFITQLQLENAEVSFAVVDVDTQQYLHIQLNTQSTNVEPAFLIDSNIQCIVENKEFFGMFTRKKNYEVIYKNLSQNQVFEQLDLFLNGQIEKMTEQYKQLLHKKMLQEQRMT